MLAWPHSGFHVHDGVWVAAADREFAVRLARYCARNPVALSRLAYQSDDATVTYHSHKPTGPTAGSETLDLLEFPASGPEVSVEVSVNPVRKRLQLRQQRTRCAEIRTFSGVSRTRCRHWVPHSPALQARALSHSATCPEWCNRLKRNVLARQAKVRRLHRDQSLIRDGDAMDVAR